MVATATPQRHDHSLRINGRNSRLTQVNDAAASRVADIAKLQSDIIGLFVATELATSVSQRCPRSRKCGAEGLAVNNKSPTRATTASSHQVVNHPAVSVCAIAMDLECGPCDAKINPGVPPVANIRTLSAA